MSFACIVIDEGYLSKEDNLKNCAIKRRKMGQTGNPKRKDKLKHAQTEWIANRDGECNKIVKKEQAELHDTIEGMT
jgi:uncharacterized protein YecT (DUF1311 family)